MRTNHKVPGITGRWKPASPYASGYREYATADYTMGDGYKFYRKYFARQNQVERYNYKNKTFFNIEQHEQKNGKIRLLESPLWRKVVGAYNRKVAEAILEGKTFKMPAGLNTVNIEELVIPHRIDKNGVVQHKSVDWKTTRALDNKNEKGRLIRVFKTDDTSYRIIWHRTQSVVRNSFMYTFRPSAIIIKDMFRMIEEKPIVISAYRENSRYYKPPAK